MYDPVFRIAACGVLLALTLLSGLWVSRLGRPLNIAVFTLHKLAALAAVILSAVTIWQSYRSAGTPAPVETALAAADGLFIAALFASGALLSFERPAPTGVLHVHQITPVFTIAATAAAFFLLYSRL